MSEMIFSSLGIPVLFSLSDKQRDRFYYLYDKYFNCVSEVELKEFKELYRLAEEGVKNGFVHPDWKNKKVMSDDEIKKEFGL